MSKVSIEVDLEFLEEGQSVDDFVRDEIVHAATKRIDEIITRTTEEKCKESLAKAQETIDQKVIEITTKTIDDFVSTQKFPCPKNSYDKTPEYKSITEILCNKLEASLMKTVDKNGALTDSSYDRCGTRLDWLTGKLAEKHADERVKECTKNIKQHIEKFILEKVKGEIMNQLSTSILNNIDFSKIK
jgi:hypothetical protein